MPDITISYGKIPGLIGFFANFNFDTLNYENCFNVVFPPHVICKHLWLRQSSFRDAEQCYQLAQKTIFLKIIDPASLIVSVIQTNGLAINPDLKTSDIGLLFSKPIFSLFLGFPERNVPNPNEPYKARVR